MAKSTKPNAFFDGALLIQDRTFSRKEPFRLEPCSPYYANAQKHMPDKIHRAQIEFIFHNIS